MVHHTAGPDGTPAPSRSVVRTGRPDLAGPLCHILARRDMVAEIVSRGRANHAGTGQWGSMPTDSGNTYCLGIEIEHEGTDAEPWRPEFREWLKRLEAGCLDHLNVSSSRLLAHKEYAPSRKIDPWEWNMNSERSAVAALLSAGPGAGTPPTIRGELTMFIAWHSNVPYLVTDVKRKLSPESKDTIKNETRAAGNEIMDVGEVPAAFLDEFPTVEEAGVFAGTSYNDVQATKNGVTQLRADVANLNAKLDTILAAIGGTAP
jgi:hypothetical protein